MRKNENLERLMDYAGDKKPLIILSWILGAVSAICMLLPFVFIWLIVRAVLESEPAFENAQHVSLYGWLAVLFAALSVLLYLGSLLCSHKAAFRVATNIRIELIKHITKLPLGCIEQMGSGKLRGIIADTSSGAETYLAHQLPDKYRAYATIAGLLVCLLFFDWRLGLFSLLPVIIGFLVMKSMTGESLKQKMTEYQNALANMSNEAVEYVRGIPVVKIFGQTVFSFKRFKESIERYSQWAIAYTKEMRRPMMLYTLAVNSVFVFLILAGILFTGNEVSQMFILNLVFYIIITPVISINLSKLMRQSENEMMVVDSLQRIDTVLSLPPLVSGEEGKPQNASVTLDHVTYSYDGKRNALSDISLEIPAGATVAFVGASGGGKSTIAAIISRFFDPQEGLVKIGDTDVREIPKDQLMNTVSFVFQNSRLIQGSILDNVRLGKPDASEQEVTDALEKAQCMDIIEKFPKGIHTILGTEGVYLSCGEQQRIAIARAILKNAPIIILDEATAFADPDNEVKVQEAFTQLMEGRTVIMIAHRLSTVKGADQIYVLQNGCICEEGRFDELKENNGIFAHMWEAYNQSVEWKVGNAL